MSYWKDWHEYGCLDDHLDMRLRANEQETGSDNFTTKKRKVGQ
ncbi:MAG: hypothetical protein OXI38_09365 [Bacteroidota bacterium]|nr:hypothetical protein [Bacteroidota bacterium]